MIRFLRDNSFDIVCVQESHTSNDIIINTINTQFQSTSTLWTAQCGIVSLNKDIILTPLDTNSTTDDRILFTQVTHSQHYFAPFFILNLYAPSNNGRVKTTFFQNLSEHPFLTNPDIVSRLFILGDFNYSYSRQNQMRYIPDSWLTFLHSNFTDCLTSPYQNPIPSFHRNASTQSTIDYIYAAQSLHPNTSQGSITHISSSWSDHNILSLDYCVGQRPTGRGVWRFNPLLLKNEKFCSELTNKLHDLHPQLSSYGDIHHQWDQVKQVTKKMAKSFSGKYISWRAKRLKKLQSERNTILRRNPSFEMREQLLPPIQNEIIQLQQDAIDIAKLRSGLRWRENGELAAGYLKRTIATQAQHRRIEDLIHPVSGVRCSNDPESYWQQKLFTLIYLPRTPSILI
ncbi:hypothetical protein BD770DRAFT_328348 [Pilaira anomala]|nr:hypothetical protein BD770DRAFT_328348 [Pilaira anomala]